MLVLRESGAIEADCEESEVGQLISWFSFVLVTIEDLRLLRGLCAFESPGA